MARSTADPDGWAWSDVSRSPVEALRSTRTVQFDAVEAADGKHPGTPPKRALVGAASRYSEAATPFSGARRGRSAIGPDLTPQVT